MATITFTTSNKVELTINGNEVSAVNYFGDRFRGTLNENGKLVCKGRLSLAVLMRAMDEYKKSIA